MPARAMCAVRSLGLGAGVGHQAGGGPAVRAEGEPAYRRQSTLAHNSATSSTMDTIGIRELRQRASDYLRRVAAGETFEVTDRGRPIALLTPIPSSSPLDRLRAAGDLDEATGSTDDLPEPVDLAPGTEPPAVRLERLRSDER